MSNKVGFNFDSNWTPARDLAAFEKNKSNDVFVGSLARFVSSQVQVDQSAEAVAQLILSKSNYDSEFGGKLLSRMQDEGGLSEEVIDAGKLEKVKRIIHESGVLKPSEVYEGPKVEGGGGLGGPVVYERGALQEIIPSDDKEEGRLERLAMMTRFLSGGGGVPDEVDQQVHDVLMGKSAVESLPITEENSRDYLNAAKLWDHAKAIENHLDQKHTEFPVSSYDLRTHVASIGNIQSKEAYTKTLNPNEFNDRAFLAVQRNWIPERAGLHAKIVANHLVLALALSRRLNTDKPTIWAVRGNVGAGKTYCIGHDDTFKRALDDHGEPSGAINPDTFKGILKQQTKGLSHVQLHDEGSALSVQFANALSKEAVNATMIIDRRLAGLDEVKHDVVSRTENRAGGALLLDIETPMVTSVNRILTRPIDGFDAPVPEWVIKSGYVRVKKERAAVIDEVKNNDNIKYYKLYVTDDSGDKILAAKKENGQFQVMDGMEDWFTTAQTEPNEKGLEKVFDQVIDEDYIQTAISRDHISKNKIGMISRWEGYTVREALERHCREEGPER